MTKQEKIATSKAVGRFKYLVIAADDTEYGLASTFYHAVADAQKCKGEVWLNGKMVQTYKE
jgi:hypothetical protein